MTSTRNRYDVVVVGGGHNGLVAATYLARAGLSVLVLERLGRVGGAAASRYADRVGPLPHALIADLGLDLRFAAGAGSPTGADAAVAGHPSDLADLARVVAPSLLEPLPTRRAIRAQVDPSTWHDLVTRPLGEALEARIADDAARGAVAAEAVTGTAISLHDPSLEQNRRFLYAQIGRIVGGRRVLVGGADAVSSALARAAIEAGAEILTSAGVSGIDAVDDGAAVSWDDATGRNRVGCRRVLSNVAPWVLEILLGRGEEPALKPEGAQLRVILRLARLPRPLSGTTAEVAFAGGLRCNTSCSQLEAAADDAAAGQLPAQIPGEWLRSPGDRLALTFLGSHTPESLFTADSAAIRELALSRVLADLDRRLVEPIESCLATDRADGPAVEVLTPQDVERELAMPGGHMFHGDLDWPWAPDRARLDIPAEQWGVQTDVGSVLICGAGSRRGGGISGLGGHSAAHAVLATV